MIVDLWSCNLSLLNVTFDVIDWKESKGWIRRMNLRLQLILKLLHGGHDSNITTRFSNSLVYILIS